MGNETLRLSAILPASLLALASLLEADAGSTARAFKRAVSPFHWTEYTCDSERGHAEGVPIAFRRSISFPSGNHGYMRNLRRFLRCFFGKV